MSSDHTRWRKSSYSGGQGGNCVEVAERDGMILVRDTKDPGHVHPFSAAGWRAFIANVNDGVYDPSSTGRLP